MSRAEVLEYFQQRVETNAGTGVVFSGASSDSGLATKLGVGGGVTFGRVVFGAVGSDARRDYTVIGNRVNRAAHLGGAARPWELLLPPEEGAQLPENLQAYLPDEVPVRTRHKKEALPMRSHRRTQLTQTPR